MIGQLDLVLVGFLAEVMEPMTISAGDYVYSTGELPDRVFFVDQGQVKLEWDDGSVAWAANGAAFGFAEPHGREPTAVLAPCAILHVPQPRAGFFRYPTINSIRSPA